MNIGDLCTVTYEQSKQLRKEGWRPRNDVVVMMFVGKPEEPQPSNRSRSHTVEFPASPALRMRRYREKKRAEARS